MKRHPQQVMLWRGDNRPFKVSAGKYDGSEPNTKYCDTFATFEDAYAAYLSVRDYPWSTFNYVEYDGALFTINLDPVLKD